MVVATAVVVILYNRNFIPIEQFQFELFFTMMTHRHRMSLFE